MNNVVGSNVPNNLKFKISWVVSLLGALAIVGLTALWAIEMISYGRHFISKIEAFVILLMASALLTYCIIIFKGVKAGKFKSQSVLLFEIGAYCYLAITTILFLSMAIELVLPKVQNWQDALDSMFLPTLMMLFAFSISIFYVIKNRRVIPVSGYEALPQKWSPLWSLHSL